MVYSILFTLSSLVSIFSLVCLVRIIFTWIPSVEHSAAGRFLSRICDPYLNWFRRFSFTRIGVIDFSPILALATLSALTMILSTILATGRISVTVVLFALLHVLWSFFSFLLNILILFLFIRLIYDLFNRYGYSPVWTMIDRFLNPVISRVTRIFSGSKPVTYRLSLFLTLAVLLALRIGLSFGMKYLYLFLSAHPM